MIKRVIRKKKSLENYQKNKIGRKGIVNSNFMMCVRPSMKKYLEKYPEEFSFEGCTMFYSMWEGYKKQENMKEFLKFMEEKGVKTISLHTSGHADEKDFDKLIKSQNFEREETDIENEGKDIILDIISINLEGNTIFEDFQIDAFLRKYIGRDKNIYALINELENKYIESGYITTKVGLNMEKSDFESGDISLFILEGKIDKVFYDGKENKFKTFITFSQRENNILNIRDLD